MVITSADLKTQTKNDLAQTAKRLGVSGWNALSKVQLVAAIVKQKNAPAAKVASKMMNKKPAAQATLAKAAKKSAKTQSAKKLAATRLAASVARSAKSTLKSSAASTKSATVAKKTAPAKKSASPAAAKLTAKGAAAKSRTQDVSAKKPAKKTAEKQQPSNGKSSHAAKANGAQLASRAGSALKSSAPKGDTAKRSSVPAQATKTQTAAAKIESNKAGAPKKAAVAKRPSKPGTPPTNPGVLQRIRELQVQRESTKDLSRAGEDAAKSDLAKSLILKNEIAKSESAKKEQAKRDQARKEQARRELAKKEQAKAEQARSDAAKGEAGKGEGQEDQQPKDRIVLVVRDAYWLQVTWDITRRAVERARAAMAEHWHHAQPILRLLRLDDNGTTSAAETIERDIVIHGGVRNWYLDLNGTPGRFRVMIGYLSGNRFHMLAKSNIVRTPTPGTSDAVDDHWSDIARDAERVFALSGGYDSEQETTELQEVFEDRLKRSMGGPQLAQYGSGAETAFRGRGGFHFDMEVELYVYGSTVPDGFVTLNNEPVKLRSDGTFSLRMPFPDRRQVLPAVACSRDGVQQRTVVVAVERNTKVMEPFSKEQDDQG